MPTIADSITALARELARSQAPSDRPAFHLTHDRTHPAALGEYDAWAFHRDAFAYVRQQLLASGMDRPTTAQALRMLEIAEQEPLTLIG